MAIENSYKIRTKGKNLFLRVTKGHFMKTNGHMNYYIDVTMQKSRLSEARAVAEELVSYLAEHTDIVPGDDAEMEALDFALASMAIEEAVRRHAGTIEETYTMMGQTFVQSGKNLTKVKQIVVTGGSLIHTRRTEEIAAHALYSPKHPQSLRPKAADVWVDRTYILAAMGLLSSYYPKTALRIMKKELEYHGYSE